MLNIDTSNRTEQRKFGLVMAVAFFILGFIRYAWHSFAVIPSYLWSIALVFLVLGVVAPRVLKPLFVWWIKLATVMNWIMTRVFLGIAFFFIATPMRVGVLLFGEDPLKRAWLPKDQTYWEAPEDQPREFERYKDQY